MFFTHNARCVIKKGGSLRFTCQLTRECKIMVREIIRRHFKRGIHCSFDLVIYGNERGIVAKLNVLRQNPAYKIFYRQTFAMIVHKTLLRNTPNSLV